jgi:hypothetical protein
MKSMTGYYPCRKRLVYRVCNVEIIVNSRTDEPSNACRTSPFSGARDAETVGKTILRGKVDINIELRDTARQVG